MKIFNEIKLRNLITFNNKKNQSYHCSRICWVLGMLLLEFQQILCFLWNWKCHHQTRINWWQAQHREYFQSQLFEWLIGQITNFELISYFHEKLDYFLNVQHELPHATAVCEKPTMFLKFFKKLRVWGIENESVIIKQKSTRKWSFKPNRYLKIAIRNQFWMKMK